MEQHHGDGNLEFFVKMFCEVFEPRRCSCADEDDENLSLFWVERLDRATLFKQLIQIKAMLGKIIRKF